MYIVLKNIGQKIKGSKREYNFKGVLRNLNSLKKRVCESSSIVENIKIGEVIENIKRETFSEDNIKKPKNIVFKKPKKYMKKIYIIEIK